MRTTSAFLVLLMSSAAAAQGPDALTGYWKLSLTDDSGKAAPIWLIKLESKAGKLTGTLEGVRGVPAATLADARLEGERLSFTINVKTEGGIRAFPFEGLLPKGGLPKTGDRKILGSLPWGDDEALTPAQLETTTFKDAFELEKDIVTRLPNDPRVFAAVQELIAMAANKKTPVKDVQAWVETALSAADKHGPRFVQETARKYALMLLTMEGYGNAALTAARRAEKGLSAKDAALDQLATLDVLALAHQKAGQKIPAELQARIAKLEPAGRDEHHAKVFGGFKIEKFVRKNKSQRAVLVELFTGAQCPPCIAADVAFDALAKTYQPSEVVLLQYHEHIPAPDALTNADAEARLKHYGDDVEGTPTVFLNGRAGPPTGGGLDAAAERFKRLRQEIEPLLEEAAQATLKVEATRRKDKIAIKVAAGVDKPGDKMRLRIVLVEDWVRYRGHNTLSYHHHVVRAMPGGPQGIALTKKANVHTAEVDLDDLRKSLNKYLDAFHKSKEGPLLDDQRPMRLEDLRVVAFVQNDDTREVLQAAETKKVSGTFN